MTDLNELLERMKAATGPDRELDVALLHLWDSSHDALRSYDERYDTELRDGVFSVRKIGGGYAASVPFPRFTASIDAALALVERALPERWEIDMGTCGQDDMPWACVTEPDEPCRDFAASAPTIPLAMLDALLQALNSGASNVL